MRYLNSIGTSVKDNNKLAANEMITESDRGENKYFAVPVSKKTGTNTTLMHKVARNVGSPTSEAPLVMEDSRGSPRPRCRSMFSMTTVALSTKIPTARAKPPNVIVLRVWPPRYKITTAVTIDNGTEAK